VAGFGAQATAVAFFFIDGNNSSDHIHPSLYHVFYKRNAPNDVANITSLGAFYILFHSEPVSVVVDESVLFHFHQRQVT
jgi:hypothetical protein